MTFAYEEAIAVLTELKRGYQLAFNSAAGQAVLDDLAIFCHANKSCAVPGNSDQTFLHEGRRQSYLRIRDFLDLTTDELASKYIEYTGPQKER